MKIFTSNSLLLLLQNLKTKLDGKSDTSHTHDNRYYTESEIDTKLNGKSDTSHTHNYAGSSSAGGAATSATKLATARTIGLGTGVTSTATSFDGSSNITIPVNSIKESYLTWGGKNFSGSYGCIDAAMVSDLGANRLMFGKAAGITIQYSTNGGSTWTDYGASDSAKVGLFSSGYGFNIGKATKDTLTTNCMLRVIINTDAFGVYTSLNKFVIYLSTSGCGGCYCTIDASLESSPTTFTTFANKVPVNGWSGYNVINTSGITTYGNNPSSQYGLIRFTFGCTSVNTNYSGLSVSQIMGFGGVGWSTPSTMAKTGHLYSYDSSQNATFPAKVTAPTFSGALSGNASTATTATKLGTSTVGGTTTPIYLNNGTPTALGYTIAKSVPSNAKFTDTTYSVATTSANGLMSSTDKSKLDGIATGANNYSLPAATSSTLGGVKVGSNITNSSGTISLTKANVTSALGYTPPTTNTTYNVATSTTNGLMSAADKKLFDYTNNQLETDLDNLLDKPAESIADIIYPVGSIYMSVNSVNPGALFGGTWEQIAQGRTLFGAGRLNGIKYTAGEKIDAGLPDPQLNLLRRQDSTSSGVYKDIYGTNGYTAAAPSNTGGTDEWMQSMKAMTATDRYMDVVVENPIYGKSKTVQPPALVVYIWKRTV